MQPDFAKVRAAVLRMRTPAQTPAALELISSAPVHIRPAPIHMSLPAEDATRRKPTGKIHPDMRRPHFGSSHHFFH